MADKISFDEAVAGPATGRISFEDATGRAEELQKRYGDVGARDYLIAGAAFIPGGTVALDKLGVKSQYATDLQRTMLNGMTMGWSDELVGRAQALANKIKGEGETDYRKLRDEERKALQMFAEGFPKTALAAEVGGGIVVPGGAIKTAATGAKLTAAQLRNLATREGAKYGAVQGAGSSEAEIGDGDLKGLAVDTGTGLALGGVTGNVVNRATGGLVRAKDAVGSVAGRFASTQRSADKWAENRVLEALQADGITTPAQLDAAIAAARANSFGGPATGIDLADDQIVKLARTAIGQAVGDRNAVGRIPASQLTRELEDAQGRGLTPNVQTAIDDRMNVAPMNRDARALNEADDAAKSRDYRRIQDAIEETELTAPELRAIMQNPAVAEAMKAAQREMAVKFKPLTADQKRLLEDVEVTAQGPGRPQYRPIPATAQGPSHRPWNPDEYSIRASEVTEGPRPTAIVQRDAEVPLEYLDDIAKSIAQTARVANREGRDATAHNLGIAKDRVDAAIDTAVGRAGGPDIMGARQSYRARSGAIEARNLGRTTFDMSQGVKLDEALADMRRLSPSERNDFTVGYLQGLRDEIGRIGNAGFKKEDPFSSPQHAQIMDQIMSWPGTSENIRQTLRGLMERNQRNASLSSMASRREVELGGGPQEDAIRAGLLTQAGAFISAFRSGARGLAEPLTPKRADALVNMLLQDVGNRSGAAQRDFATRYSEALQRARNPGEQTRIIADMLAQSGVRTGIERNERSPR